MPADHPSSILNTFISALNVGDLDSSSSLLLDEFFGYRPKPGEQAQPEAFLEIAQAVRAGCPDMRITLEGVAPDGEELRGQMTIQGIFTGSLWGVPGNGAAIKLTGTAIARFDAGRM